jgi:hypothetical protein
MCPATRPFPWLAHVLAGCCLQVSSKGCPFAACGTCEAEQPVKVAEELQRWAQHLRTFAVGTRTPSPEPRLLHELTDELQVTASDEVNPVCSPLVAGKGARYTWARAARTGTPGAHM